MNTPLKAITSPFPGGEVKALPKEEKRG
jgi:hypothetical protein